MSSSPRVFSFKKQLTKGQKAEAQFSELFKDLVTRTEGYVEDFIINKGGAKLDLKTDFYCPSKTENFFMERYSYNKEPGGSWQALAKGVDYIVYFYPSCMQFHCFSVPTLVKELDKICKDRYLLNIYNQSHTTQGYLVKREELAHIELNLMKVLRGQI
jgi:hypothetical protein